MQTAGAAPLSDLELDLRRSKEQLEGMKEQLASATRAVGVEQVREVRVRCVGGRCGAAAGRGGEGQVCVW